MLKHGYSERTVSQNIATEMEAGRKQTQAVAIALKEARKAWDRRFPGVPYPQHLHEKHHKATKRRRTATATRRRKPVAKRRTTATRRSRRNPVPPLQKWVVFFVHNRKRKFYVSGDRIDDLRVSHHKKEAHRFYGEASARDFIESMARDLRAHGVGAGIERAR